LAREAESSTGMEKGIAIPHAQDESIKGSAMLIAKLEKPIKWKTFDDQPVDVVISFLIPDEDDGSSHLEYLSSTSKLLMHSEFVESLKKAQTKDEILKLFK
jgi:Phosphotransferase system mannitol/fructose-specific IIA domain (Ntr-type)